MLSISLLACPICNAAFEQVDTALKCANAHTFDIAREGYVNLLRKKLPGDTKEMLVARRAFLEQGYYQPLSDTINELVRTHLTSVPVHILDAGCGEGYYLARLQQALASDQAQYVGLDISKEAVRMAAKRYPQACFVVANLKERLVFPDHALHVILNIFAPRNPAEFARILAPGGLLLVVIPAEEHLLHLRTTLHLLTIEEQKQQKVQDLFSPYFDFVAATPLTYDVHFNHDEIMQAVMMTPNYWHLSDEIRHVMDGMQSLETQAAFTCLVFRCKE